MDPYLDDGFHGVMDNGDALRPFSQITTQNIGPKTDFILHTFGFAIYVYVCCTVDGGLSEWSEWGTYFLF